MNAFEDNSRKALREQEDALDGTTLARIGVARRAALAAASRPWWRLHVPAIGGAVLATAVAMAVLIPSQQEHLRPETTASKQLAEDPGFYQDLDFYLWLAESGMDDRG